MGQMRKKSRALFIKKQISKLLLSRVGINILYFFIGNRFKHRGTMLLLPDDKYIIAMVFWHLYESSEFRFLRLFFRNDLDCIEFGSSIGVISSYIAKNINRDKKFICVEANPASYVFLKDNISNNSKGVNLFIYNRAICYSSDHVYMSSGKNNLVSHTVPENELNTSKQLIKVPTIGLNQILEENRICDWFQLICDIEGSEVELLDTDFRSFERCAIFILETHKVKYNEHNFTTDAIIDLITNKTNLSLVSRNGEICVFVNNFFE